MPSPRAKLLVLDDEAPLVAALRNTLPKDIYEVEGVTSPAEALTRLATQKFELLLTDLEMPEMNGIEVLRATLQRDRHVIPIVMTGHGTIDTAVEAMKSGAFDYILKPFKLGVVLPVLARAVAVRRLRIENELLHAGLKRRTAELEAMNRDLEAFSYSVSHDLRAPLRAVAGFGDLLRREIDGGDLAIAKDMTERICTNAARMSELIDDLMRLSRASQTQLRHVKVDLNALAREIADRFVAENPARSVEWNIADDLCATGDLGLLRLALENLLSNAWKYTGKVANARIEIGRELGDNGTPIYFVRDNGAGFEMQYAERLFAPFQRLHLAKDFPGTGIGLATVQRIVHKHGGRIWAEAAPARGATFRFTLPAPPAADGEMPM
jgi:two-component system, sensor histidine kinase and response regulator